MEESAKRLVEQGITDQAEVARVIGDASANEVDG
jgi:hypothetical protein